MGEIYIPLSRGADESALYKNNTVTGSVLIPCIVCVCGLYTHVHNM